MPQLSQIKGTSSKDQCRIFTPKYQLILDGVKIFKLFLSEIHWHLNKTHLIIIKADIYWIVNEKTSYFNRGIHYKSIFFSLFLHEFMPAKSDTLIPVCKENKIYN